MKKLILYMLLCGSAIQSGAQNNTEIQKYRRSSLYSILVSHSDAKFHKEIEDVFLQIPIPEKFDNHDLSVKVVTSQTKKSNEAEVSTFLAQNNIARRMVGRWFDRDPHTGQCDMGLITSRGLYDASYFDVELAKMSQRGYGILQDAGEELIDHTFVIVNDIRYNDRSETAKAVGAGMRIAGFAAALATGNSDFIDLGNNLGDVADDIKGFGVTVTTYLYRLNWNDDIAREFYTGCYVDKGRNDNAKRAAFDNSKAFAFTYVGSQTISSGNISMQGISTYNPNQMIRKVCTRAIDESIVALQTTYDEFKIKTPIFAVSPAITAKIGLKEGVSDNKKYEVLEQYTDKNGKTGYKRVGVIRPVKGKIWDNRYMATEERAIGSNLTETTFVKVSGSDFYPGMLIREMKIN